MYSARNSYIDYYDLLCRPEYYKAPSITNPYELFYIALVLLRCSLFLLFAIPLFGLQANEESNGLVKRLWVDDNATRDSVGNALKTMGADAVTAVPMLTSALFDSNLWVRSNAALALGDLGPLASNAIPELMSIVGDPEWRVRYAALTALAAIPGLPADSLPKLEANLSDKNSFVRAAAVTAIGSLQSRRKEVLQILTKCASDKNVVIRRTAVAALGSFNAATPEAIESLRLRLNDEHLDVRLDAVTSLARVGKAGTHVLITATKHPSVYVRRAAILAARNSGPPAGALLDALTSATHDEDIQARELAIGALSSIGQSDTQALAAIVMALRDSNPRIRKVAVATLNHLGVAAADSITDLSHTLRDTDAEVRRLSIDALVKVAPKRRETVPVLLDILRRDEDVQVQTQAISALGQLGLLPELVVPALTAALDSEDFRAVAVSALSNFGDASASALPTFLKLLQLPLHPRLHNATANVVADIGKALQDSQRVNDIARLEQIHLELISKPSLTRQATELHRSIVALKAIRANQLYWQIRTFALRYPLYTLILSITLGWILAAVVMLLCFPNAVLIVGAKFAGLNFTLPDKLGRFSVPIRDLLFFGMHYNPRVLDAWVSRHTASAKESLVNELKLQLHSMYLPLPARLDGQLRTAIKHEHFWPLCARRQWCLAIVGEGGIGKSTLAYQMALWALADELPDRLCQRWRMLPVWIPPDVGFDVREGVSTFTEEVRGRLRLLTGEKEPVHQDFCEALLRNQRIVVILDGLSEMPHNPPGPSAARLQNTAFPANALIVTSRNQKIPLPCTVLNPLKLKTVHFLHLINEYLVASQHSELTLNEISCLVPRLVGVAQHTEELTPLLARMIAEQIVQLERDGLHIDNLPNTVPDLMLTYLNVLNRNRTADDPTNHSVQEAAKIIASECLLHTYTPGRSVNKTLIRGLLRNSNLDVNMLEYLEDTLSVIQTIGPQGCDVAFQLDPLSEYLAALAVVERCGSHDQRWSTSLQEIHARGTDLSNVSGFLHALRDCCEAKAGQHDVPAFVGIKLEKMLAQSISSAPISR